jgi:far upstream element-binding protein
VGATQKKKLYIPVNEYPHINFLGLLIGPKGATQKQLQDSTGAKILIRGKGASKDGSAGVHPDDDDELHVAIEGSEDAVERASREVEKILYNPDQAMKLKSEQLRTLAEMNQSDGIYGPGGSSDSYQIELRVPNNMVGLIIGRGGENILRIQTQLSVNVQIAKESEMKPGETLRSIVIKGQEDNVEEAKKRIDEIIAQHNQKHSGQMFGSGNMKELDTKYVLKVPVPNDKVGIIIGKGGMNIKGIQEKTKTTVQIPQVPDEDNPNVRTILIGGDIQDSIYQARDEILLTIQMQQQSVAQQLGASLNPMFVTVPDDKVGIIIGKGGATVKDIQNRLNVKIQIPQSADVGSNPPVRTISIVGPVEFQPVAKYEIEMIVAGTPVQSVGAGASAAAWTGTASVAAAWPQQAYAQYYSDPAYAAAAYQYGYYGSVSVAVGTTDAAASAEQDPTAYYNDFWQYAQYYGEAAARAYYQAWSPPEGTSPPEGMVIPSAEVASANIAAANAMVAGATTADVSIASEQKQIEEAPSSESAPVEDEAWEAYKRQVIAMLLFHRLLNCNFIFLFLLVR